MGRSRSAGGGDGAGGLSGGVWVAAAFRRTVDSVSGNSFSSCSVRVSLMSFIQITFG